MYARLDGRADSSSLDLATVESDCVRVKVVVPEAERAATVYYAADRVGRPGVRPQGSMGPTQAAPREHESGRGSGVGRSNIPNRFLPPVRGE